MVQQLQNQQNQPQYFNDDKFWLQYKNFSLDRQEDLSQNKSGI